MTEHPSSVVRNSSEAPLQLPLDVWGRSSRMVLPSDTTVLPWEARHSQRVTALIRMGQLQVIDDNVMPPQPRAAPLAAVEHAPDPEDDTLAGTDPEEEPMPLVETTSAGNGIAAPRKQVRAKRVRKRRLSGGARRSLAKRAALTQTAEAAQAWANGNGHAGLVVEEIATEATGPDVDPLAAARLALASRVLAITERVLAIAEAG